MAETSVAVSHDTLESALNLNVKAFQLRTTLAAVWDLDVGNVKSAVPESAEAFRLTNHGAESVVGDDERVKVDNVHFGPGGKYRSIVKLFCRYEFGKSDQYMMGTGWLVAPDIFVTAGHCSYDWSKKLGRAIEVKSYIGYDGQGSIKGPNVQFRKVKRIATTEGWVRAKGQKAYDVSFMQVDKPFTDVTPYKFEATPARGNFSIGVVGYPGDIADPTTREKGARMYEMFLQTDFDLATQQDTMLEYQIDTYGGNSGSPVFREKDLVSIGCHVYGGERNSASVIGTYGNPYEDYLAAFGLTLPPGYSMHLSPVKKVESSALSSPAAFPKNNPSVPRDRIGSSYQGQSRRDLPLLTRREMATPRTPTTHMGRVPQYGQSESEEGLFGDILKGVSATLPILGGPFGALAGVALNTAGSLLAESTTAEGFTDTAALPEGSVERAILAEASLQVLQSTRLPSEVEEGIYDDMKSAVLKALPVVRKAAPRIIGAMVEPALKIALDSLHNYNQQSTDGAESFSAGGPALRVGLPATQYSTAIDQPADHQTEAFLDAVLAVRQNGQEPFGDSQTEEGFIDIFKSATRLIGQGVLGVAKTGLPIVVDYLDKTGEAGFFDAERNSNSETADLLAKRALVADAALQAIMKVPPQQLQEEGFFDSLFEKVKQIAPHVIKAAPGIIKAINPTIGGIVSGMTG